MRDVTYTAPTTAVDSDVVAEFAGRVYGWVAGGLFLSGFTAWAVYSDASRLQSAEDHLLLWILAPFVPLLILMFGAQRMSPPLSAITYLAFCALEGIGLGVIVSYYASESVALALVTTAGVFTTMAVIGTVTKRDLTSLGGFLLVALIGLILASFANLFFASSAADVGDHLRRRRDLHGPDRVRRAEREEAGDGREHELGQLADVRRRPVPRRAQPVPLPAAHLWQELRPTAR